MHLTGAVVGVFDAVGGGVGVTVGLGVKVGTGGSFPCSVAVADGDGMAVALVVDVAVGSGVGVGVGVELGIVGVVDRLAGSLLLSRTMPETAGSVTEVPNVLPERSL